MSVISNLNYNERPGFVEAYIDVAFNDVRNSHRSWAYNGQKSYHLFEINEHELFAKMIQNAPKKQKNFYALDLGAGNFSWVNGCAQFINQQANLPEGIKVHIIGVRGEPNGWEFQEEEVGRCKLYKWGAIKIEHLVKEFQRKGLKIEGKLELCISTWTLCHCVDAVSMVMQVHDILRPGRGVFLFDQFHFTYKNESMFKHCRNIPFTDDFSDPLSIVGSRVRTIQLLFDMKVPFLVSVTSRVRSHDSFMLQRQMTTTCILPMQYSKVFDLTDKRTLEIAASGSFISFSRSSQEEDTRGFDFPMPPDDSFEKRFYGDKTLYTYLRTQLLFKESSRVPTYSPIRKETQDCNSEYLFRAIRFGHTNLVKDFIIENSYDLNHVNALGFTALHLAICHQRVELISFFLDQGASVHLSNYEGKTPLAFAAESDQTGAVIETLLKAGADVNGKDDCRRGISPLSGAVAEKNKIAIALLFKNGAKASTEILKMLESEEFLDLHRKGVIPLATSGNNFMIDIVTWIDSGYCVVLHENGARMHGYFQKEKQGAIKKLIVVDFHPDQNLLDPTELPELIRFKPCLTSLAAFNALDQTQFDSKFTLSLGYTPST
jgi:hypothetical protein